MKKMLKYCNSSRYFKNTECEYFPCHSTGGDGFNCLFCYCPLYHYKCPGKYKEISIKGRVIKDCTDCIYPHIPENYDNIIKIMEKISCGKENSRKEG